eukprot:5641159-Alexandrium_andersonii.AAC.1
MCIRDSLREVLEALFGVSGGGRYPSGEQWRVRGGRQPPEQKQEKRAGRAATPFAAALLAS